MTDLSKADWLTDERAKKLITALEAKGARVRFVGGCVRDFLLGIEKTHHDLDLAIDCAPEKTQTLLEEANIKPIPLGLAHGTVGCVIEGLTFEITTLRQDIKTDGRHAEVAFTTDWVEDAKRRDFTINALYADPDGTLYDPLGGEPDLQDKRVRFIGDAATRIEEDVLRILRFFRFFSTLSTGEIDRAGIAACSAAKDGLAKLSAERVQTELLRLLPTPRAPEALRLMAAAGILPCVLPHARGTELFEKMHTLMSDNFLPLDEVRLLSALYDEGAGAASDGEKLKLSNAVMKRLEKILTPAPLPIKSYISIREVRKLLYLLGVETFCDKVWLGWAADENLSAAVGWRALLALAESWERPSFLLTGQMVKTAGVTDGVAIGRIMREVEEWWIDADFIDDEFSVIERLKAVVQATIYTRH